MSPRAREPKSPIYPGSAAPKCSRLRSPAIRTARSRWLHCTPEGSAAAAAQAAPPVGLRPPSAGRPCLGLEGRRLPVVRAPKGDAPALLTEAALLRMSARTIDRILRAKRGEVRRRLYGHTRSGALLKHQIPIRAERGSERAGMGPDVVAAIARATGVPVLPSGAFALNALHLSTQVPAKPDS